MRWPTGEAGEPAARPPQRTERLSRICLHVLALAHARRLAREADRDVTHDRVAGGHGARRARPDQRIPERERWQVRGGHAGALVRGPEPEVECGFERQRRASAAHGEPQRKRQ
jgi:hypothetical protein